MKFKKIFLEESIFDDSVFSTYDDVLSFDDNTFDSSDTTNVPEGPEPGSDYGVADMLITAINDEWETIKKYNSIIASLRYEANSHPEYNAYIDVLNEVNNEENKHVGQLQELLSRVSPNAESVHEGEAEGESQLNALGKLQVQSWAEVTTQKPVTQNEIDTNCTITDIDDEM